MTTPNYASKGTPNKSGTISKSLLTPCRRVGLGRKATGKSPLTPSPLVKQAVLRQSESPVQKDCVEDEDKGGSKGSKELKTDELVSTNENYEESNKNEIEKVSKAVCAKRKSGTGKAKQGASNEKPKTDNCKKEKTKDRKQNTDYVKEGEKEESGSYNKSKASEDANQNQENTNCNDQVSQPLLKNHKKANKTDQVKNSVGFTKSLSMKKSDSDDGFSESDDLPLVSNVASVSQNIKDLGIEKIIAPARKSSKRKLILDLPDEEGCNGKNLEQNINVPKRRPVSDLSSEEVSKSVPTESKSKTTPILESSYAGDELEHLRRVVKEKEDRLAKLRQAEVYRRIHNIEELEQLTARWKKGCQDALRQVVDKLQEHGLVPTLDMLMTKFNISSDTLTYDNKSDFFLHR